MECPECQTRHEPDDRFCRRCGTQLTGQQPPGRFRPLFQRAPDPASPWHDYVRPFFLAALWFCLGLSALLGVVYLIGKLMSGD